MAVKVAKHHGYGHVTLERGFLICKITGLVGCFLGPLNCTPLPFLKAILARTCRNMEEKPLLLGDTGLSPIKHSVSRPGVLFSEQGEAARRDRLP